MARELKYFKYNGRPIGGLHNDKLETQLTEAIDYIGETLEVVQKELYDVHDKMWPRKSPDDDSYPRETDQKMYDLLMPKYTELKKLINRYYYDIDNLKKSRGILRRYKKTIYGNNKK